MVVLELLALLLGHLAADMAAVAAVAHITPLPPATFLAGTGREAVFALSGPETLAPSHLPLRGIHKCQTSQESGQPPSSFRLGGKIFGLGFPVRRPLVLPLRGTAFARQ